MSVRACSQTIRRWHLFMARDYIRMKNARSMSTVRCSFYVVMLLMLLLDELIMPAVLILVVAVAEAGPVFQCSPKRVLNI